MLDKVRGDDEIPGFTAQSGEACVSLHERKIGMFVGVMPRSAYL